MITPIINFENDIRITANCTFSAKDAYDNTFEDLIMEKVAQDETKNQKPQTFYNLGMPPGLNLDTSYIDEIEATCEQ